MRGAGGVRDQGGRRVAEVTGNVRWNCRASRIVSSFGASVMGRQARPHGRFYGWPSRPDRHTRGRVAAPSNAGAPTRAVGRAVGRTGGNAGTPPAMTVTWTNRLGSQPIRTDPAPLARSYPLTRPMGGGGS